MGGYPERGLRRTGPGGRDEGQGQEGGLRRGREGPGLGGWTRGVLKGTDRGQVIRGVAFLAGQSCGESGGGWDGEMTGHRPAGQEERSLQGGGACGGSDWAGQEGVRGIGGVEEEPGVTQPAGTPAQPTPGTRASLSPEVQLLLQPAHGEVFPAEDLSQRCLQMCGG